MHRKFVFAAFLLAAPTLALAAAGGKDNVTRTFTKTVSAASLTSVALNARVGEIRITTADTDTVSIKATAEPGNPMHFIFSWTHGPYAHKLPPDLHLVADRQGARLLIGLATAGSTASFPASASAAASAGWHNIVINGRSYDYGGEEGWKADWTLVLPARLALDLSSGVGKVTVSGVAGGLHVKTGVGKLDLRLPQGPVDAVVGVGDVEAMIGSAEYAKVSLAAGVGRVSFEVNDHRIETGYQHHFTSAEQHVNGSGKTVYSLKAGVGHISLRLGVKGLSKSGGKDAQDGG